MAFQKGGPMFKSLAVSVLISAMTLSSESFALSPNYEKFEKDATDYLKRERGKIWVFGVG
jgi:hypothetical protein